MLHVLKSKVFIRMGGGTRLPLSEFSGSARFLSDMYNRSPNDIELILLELIHSSRDALRKSREAYLIERDQTLEPKGINKREEI